MSNRWRPADGVLGGSGQIQFSPTPQTVCFEPLYVCNFRCFYCYIGQEAAMLSANFPPLDLTLRLLEEMHKEGVKEIYLCGGEPFAHPNFDQICQYITDLGFEDLGIVTNGSLITEQSIQTLKAGGFWIDVSFRGPNAQIFDRITRTQGSFRKVMEGLFRLRDAGVQPGIEIDLIPDNYMLLYDTLKMLMDEGISVREVFLHRIAPYGDAANAMNTRLFVEQYREVFSQARKVKQEFSLEIFFEDGMPLCLFDESARDHIIPCACGHTLANVDPVGNVRRCACHPKQYGNILEVPLHRIWQEEFAPFRSLDWLDPKCKGCTLLCDCGGGCSVTAQSEDGHTADRFSPYFVPVSSSR